MSGSFQSSARSANALTYHQPAFVDGLTGDTISTGGAKDCLVKENLIRYIITNSDRYAPPPHLSTSSLSGFFFFSLFLPASLPCCGWLLIPLIRLLPSLFIYLKGRAQIIDEELKKINTGSRWTARVNKHHTCRRARSFIARWPDLTRVSRFLWETFFFFLNGSKNTHISSWFFHTVAAQPKNISAWLVLQDPTLNKSRIWLVWSSKCLLWWKSPTNTSLGPMQPLSGSLEAMLFENA